MKEPVYVSCDCSSSEMATGSSADKSAIDRRLFQQAHISPLEAVRDFFEAISELRAAADNENTRYLNFNPAV